MNFMFFVLLSLLECGEPDWSETPKTITVPIEQRFDLDDHLTLEIQRVLKDCDERVIFMNDLLINSFYKLILYKLSAYSRGKSLFLAKCSQILDDQP